MRDTECEEIDRYAQINELTVFVCIKYVDFRLELLEILCTELNIYWLGL